MKVSLIQILLMSLAFTATCFRKNSDVYGQVQNSESSAFVTIPPEALLELKENVADLREGGLYHMFEKDIEAIQEHFSSLMNVTFHDQKGPTFSRFLKFIGLGGSDTTGSASVPYTKGRAGLPDSPRVTEVPEDDGRPPIVVAGPDLEPLAEKLRTALGSPSPASREAQNTYMDLFPSGDTDVKFKWREFVGRKVVFLFDTMNEKHFFLQLALLQGIQGFPVPSSGDEGTKWKTYVGTGKYLWGRPAQITVIIPWYRPCRMERTVRWEVVSGKRHGEKGFWTNKEGEGSYVDTPMALYYTRLLGTPGPVPPPPGPDGALDKMPVNPLWRPPLDFVFVELHEEEPVRWSAPDLNVGMRMERVVPYFLDLYSKESRYPGTDNMYVLFPDHGMYRRASAAVSSVLKLPPQNILFLDKSRVGAESTTANAIYYFEHSRKSEKTAFDGHEQILVIDDIMDSGNTLFNGLQVVKGKGAAKIDIFMTHFLGKYNKDSVETIRGNVHKLGDSSRLYITNSVPQMVNLLEKDPSTGENDPQVKVVDLTSFLVNILQSKGSE